MAHDKVYGICESKCFVPLNFFYGFTFVIDSDEKLNQWANNEQGNDYTSVLIKKGTWSSSLGVNLTQTGTKVVVGEVGSKLVFNENSLKYDLFYEEVPISPEFYMFGITVESVSSKYNICNFYNCVNLTNCTGIADNRWSYTTESFFKCSNLTNCYGSVKTTEGFASGGMANAFNECKCLNNCVGEAIEGSTVQANAFKKCYYLTKCSGVAYGYTGETYQGQGVGFFNCEHLSECIGTGVGVTISNRSALGYGFWNCYGVTKCKAGDKCFTQVFYNSYASQSENSTYACADTPEGGFNDTTNPSE